MFQNEQYKLLENTAKTDKNTVIMNPTIYGFNLSLFDQILKPKIHHYSHKLPSIRVNIKSITHT